MNILKYLIAASFAYFRMETRWTFPKTSKFNTVVIVDIEEEEEDVDIEDDDIDDDDFFFIFFFFFFLFKL